tara:strand:+ start:871 stop:1632 length:762 start_codon:yes stop_codon:yes gene_type:complete
MFPLFKSHYSVGRSILTLANPSSVVSGGSSSVFDIASRHSLERLVLVEDSLIGLLEAKRRSDELDIPFVFGLRLDMCNDISKDPKESSSHKIIVFAKNSIGLRLLNRIYTQAQTVGRGRLDFTALKSLYSEEDLKIAIPFYDSFVFQNLFSYGEPCLLDDSYFSPTFFIEDNLLPIDVPLRAAVKKYCGSTFKIELVKSIYYENREDFEAYQTYKCICGRGFSTKSKTLDVPNLDHCGSPEFCFESYLDYERS